MLDRIERFFQFGCLLRRFGVMPTTITIKPATGRGNMLEQKFYFRLRAFRRFRAGWRRGKRPSFAS